jgi:DNA-directed RNA polymerase specialized sigma24 family protein
MLFVVVSFFLGRGGVEPGEFDVFARDAGTRLQNALVARYGVDTGADAAGDAMAYAWEHREELAVMTNPVGYLYRVAQSAVRRQHRWERRPSFPPETAGEITASEPQLPAELARLKPDVRVAVVLVHGYAWTYAEVATLLDVPVSTVRNHVHRGTSRLRKALED